MRLIDIDKAYVSPYDVFLRTFDANHAKTESQLIEILKHKKIAKLRDTPVNKEREEEIWGEF